MTAAEWVQLWPVVVVWAFLVLPYLAYSAPMLRQEIDLPWWLRAGLWLLVRTWPYTKVVKFGAALDAWPAPRLSPRANGRSGFPIYHEEQLELDLGMSDCGAAITPTVSTDVKPDTYGSSSL